jgi:hypothetical protein
LRDITQPGFLFLLYVASNRKLLIIDRKITQQYLQSQFFHHDHMKQTLLKQGYAQNDGRSWCGQRVGHYRQNCQARGVVGITVPFLQIHNEEAKKVLIQPIPINAKMRDYYSSDEACLQVAEMIQPLCRDDANFKDDLIPSKIKLIDKVCTKRHVWFGT